MTRENNFAFIDGQNLHLGTQSEGWKIDPYKFRIYLRDKFKVERAYYFLGCPDSELNDLYEDLQVAGFILTFREHFVEMKGKKKGNVDTDIVFEMMKNYSEDKCDNIVLISGDGDYVKTVKYLIQKDKFKKILFPNKRYSSLYKSIQDKYGLNISVQDIRKKIEYRK